VIDIDVQPLAPHGLFCCCHFGDPLEFGISERA
jgi:hypothetical protein